MLAHRSRAMLVPAREQQNHDVMQHAGLGHGQHDNDVNMNLEDALALQQVFDFDQQDVMLLVMALTVFLVSSFRRGHCSCILIGFPSHFQGHQTTHHELLVV